MQVLLIDDHPYSLERDMRELMGWEVLVAPTGKEAVNLSRRLGEFDLILLDHRMPGFNGDEVLVEWQRDGIDAYLLPIFRISSLQEGKYHPDIPWIGKALGCSKLRLLQQWAEGGLGEDELLRRLR